MTPDEFMQKKQFGNSKKRKAKVDYTRPPVGYVRRTTWPGLAKRAARTARAARAVVPPHVDPTALVFIRIHLARGPRASRERCPTVSFL